MSLEKFWENIKKIWIDGRGYQLLEILDENEESREAIFKKKKSRAYVLVTSKQISVQLVRRTIEKIKELGCNEAMMATLGKLTTQAKALGEQENIEFVHRKEPLVYTFDHWLVPKHRILSSREAKEIIQKYTNGKPEQLPKISVLDPAVRILRAKPGDIIEVIREIPEKEKLIEKYGEKFGSMVYELLRELTPAGREISYRLVVEEPEEFLF